MKIFKIIFIWGMLLLNSAFIKAQSFIYINDNNNVQTGTPTRSFQYVKSVRLVSGFSISASAGSSWYVRPADPHNAPQSLDKNFVRKETLLTNASDENLLSDMPVDSKATTYSYVDGLSRTVQIANVQVSPTKQDVIIPYEYDALGRQLKEYMTYAIENRNGAFRNGSLSEQGSFYNSTPAVSSDSRPFKENKFESSPLNRVTEMYGPGDIWKNDSKSVKQTLKVNTSADLVLNWNYYVSGFPDRSSANLGYYLPNTLGVEETVNEDGLISRVFRNMRGQVVLIREGDGTNWFETYNIFNPSGLLMFVIQPEGVARLANEYDATGVDKQSFLDRWCFQYQYDDEYRMIAKRSPGWLSWAYTVYDSWNRIVLTQSPAQGSIHQWTFFKYDRFNRIILKGLWTTFTSLTTIRTDAASSSVRNELENYSTSEGYSLTSTYPTGISANDLTNIVYYDRYNFLGCPNWETDIALSSFNFNNIAGFPQNVNLPEIATDVRGYQTGSKVKVIGIGQTRWLNNVVYYDKRYRTVQTTTENFIGGIDRATNSYDFAGNIVKAQLDHSSSTDALSTLREYSVDHAGRLLSLYETVNGNRVLLASNKYNELGQLVEKNIHSTDLGSTFLQSLDFRYDIRGKLTSINNSSLSNDGITNNDSNDLFGIEVFYTSNNRPTINGFQSPKIYGGAVSAVKWKADTKETTPGYVPEQRAFGFEYDALSRFKKVHYANNNNGSWTGAGGMYDEIVTNYDRNGNISGLQRNGKVNGAQSPIDNLTYTYDLNGFSNRLINVSDQTANASGFNDGSSATEEFKYDDNGNLIYDNNKQISSVSYNHLNLPELVEFTRPQDGSIDRIDYVYDALGTKLSTVVWKGGSSSNYGTQVWKTDYSGNVQYDNGALSFASTPEGRMIKNSSGFDYEYFYRDHQGNVRLTYGLLKETASYRATMEYPLDNPPNSTLGSREEQTFQNVTATRNTDPTFNYTKRSAEVLSPDKSSKTSGLTNLVGPAKSLRLLQNDKVHMEVFARYPQASGSTSVATTLALVSAVATNTFGFNSGETGYASINGHAPGLAGSNTSTTVPKAYLAFIFLDDSYQFVTAGAVGVSTSASDAFEKLERNFTASQNGYLYVYVANESNTSTSSVYFDEMLIVHQKSNNALQVTQASDYYPFGLTFNSYQAERMNDDYKSVQKNRYGFQGQETQKDLDLGWSQFKWRMHDPAIGRFVSVDPLSDQYFYNSPYAFQENKLGSGIELEGKELMGWEAYEFLVDLSIDFVNELSGRGRMERLATATQNYARVKADHMANTGQRIQTALEEGRTVQSVKNEMVVEELKAKGDLLLAEMEQVQAIAYAAMASSEAAAVNATANTATRTLTKQVNKQLGNQVSKTVEKEAVHGITAKEFTPQVGSTFKRYPTTISNGKVNIPGRPTTTGRLDFVVTEDGELILGNGHFNLSEGATRVKAAGDLKLRNGKVVEITNDSGHYLPTVKEGETFIKTFRDLGIDVSKTRLKLYGIDEAGEVQVLKNVIIE